ncbi:hypothetical protein DP64_13285 [Stutzerimonas degradans]|nr:hypothetical protein DP64_13285 [Stutzerimonas degradans]
MHESTLHTEKVIGLVDHAAILRSILNFDGVTDTTKAETLDASLVISQTAIHAFYQRDFDSSVSHG